MLPEQESGPALVELDQNDPDGPEVAKPRPLGHCLREIPFAWDRNDFTSYTYGIVPMGELLEDHERSDLFSRDFTVLQGDLSAFFGRMPLVPPARP